MIYLERAEDEDYAYASSYSDMGDKNSPSSKSKTWPSRSGMVKKQGNRSRKKKRKRKRRPRAVGPTSPDFDFGAGPTDCNARIMLPMKKNTSSTVSEVAEDSREVEVIRIGFDDKDVRDDLRHFDQVSTRRECLPRLQNDLSTSSCYEFPKHLYVSCEEFTINQEHYKKPVTYHQTTAPTILQSGGTQKQERFTARVSSPTVDIRDSGRWAIESTPDIRKEACCWCACFPKQRKIKQIDLQAISSIPPNFKFEESFSDIPQIGRLITSPSVRRSRTRSSRGEQNPESDSQFITRLHRMSKKLAPRHTSLLVLDMDETLIHSSATKIPEYDMLVMAGDNLEHEVYVKKRPYVDAFLQLCSKFAIIFVYTASNQNYADPVLDRLDIHSVVSKRFYKPDCEKYNGRCYDKPLIRMGHPLESTILVDNSPDSWRSDPRNAIRVSSWFDNPYDTRLRELIPILETFFRHCNDVREVLNANRRSFKWLKDKARNLNPAITAKYKYLENAPPNSWT